MVVSAQCHNLAAIFLVNGHVLIDVEMRILCFIDSLGSGGAQRQLTTLAVGLKNRGHEVRFLVYHPFDHFLPHIKEEGISCQLIERCSLWKRILRVRKVFRQGWQDVVLAFLEAPCLYAELARMPRQRWGLVAGERSANPAIKYGLRRHLRYFHRAADAIVCNSHTNRLMLGAKFKYLKMKAVTVYNIVDLELFRPNLAVTTSEESGNELRIVVASSYRRLKNMTGVAKALLILRRHRRDKNVIIDWYGSILEPDAYHETQVFIRENGLVGILNLHDTTTSIEKEFANASAVGLFSFFEGLPNAVCEGMACGKPILLSDVCDSGNLVKDGENGFIFNPHVPESIAGAIERFLNVPEEVRLDMGAKSRHLAESLFAADKIVSRYERILAAAALGERCPLEYDAGDAPASALKTVRRWR